MSAPVCSACGGAGVRAYDVVPDGAAADVVRDVCPVCAIPEAAREPGIEGGRGLDAIITNITDALVGADPTACEAFLVRLGEIMDENDRLRARLNAQAQAYNRALDRADKRFDDASKAATERLAQVIAERDGARTALRAVAHEIGVCHCWDFGCEPGPTDEIVAAIKTLKSYEREALDARALCDESLNVCEHGDHPAPPGHRFCSEACRACEIAPCADDAECAGVCLLCPICGAPAPCRCNEPGGPL